MRSKLVLRTLNKVAGEKKIASRGFFSSEIYRIYLNSFFSKYFQMTCCGPLWLKKNQLENSNVSACNHKGEKCPNTELFLVRIQFECGKMRTRNNSVFGHFSRSEWDKVKYTSNSTQHRQILLSLCLNLRRALIYFISLSFFSVINSHNFIFKQLQADEYSKSNQTQIR